jgi:hydroxypyruvate reductase
MRDHLTAVARGLMPETPKPAHPAFAHVSTHLIGFNRLAVDAVVRHAGSLSIPAERGSMSLQGEAAGAGETIARVLLERARQGARGCVVWGGETTVTLSDSPTVAGRVHGTRPGALAAGAPPRGGRCQELALAAARLLAETPDVGARITLLAAGTDGRDGPTDAAGAYADASIWNAILRAGQDPAAALAHHESYAALDVVDALLRCGLTGTNVMDVVIGVVE